MPEYCTGSLFSQHELEADAMDGLQLYVGLIADVLPDLGDEDVHAAAEEVIFLAPYIEQYFFALEDAVGIHGEVAQQIGFTLGKLVLFVVIVEKKIFRVEPEVADLKIIGTVVFLLFGALLGAWR